MAFDALIPWCENLERKLDPTARLQHGIGHEPDPWQVEAFMTRAPEIALRVGRQAKVIAREIGRQLQRADLHITPPTQGT